MAAVQYLPPSASRPEVPRVLDQVVMELLALDPGRLTQSAREV